MDSRKPIDLKKNKEVEVLLKASANLTAAATFQLIFYIEE